MFSCTYFLNLKIKEESLIVCHRVEYKMAQYDINGQCFVFLEGDLCGVIRTKEWILPVYLSWRALICCVSFNYTHYTE